MKEISPLGKVHNLHLILFVIYILILSTLMIWLGVGITPDRFILGLGLICLFFGRTKIFIQDWFPFGLLLVSYDFLRGFADKLNYRVHFVEQIKIDQFIFGQTPTQILQSYLYHPGVITWYDYLSTMVYFLHFVLPLGFGFLLWNKNKNEFKQFTFSLLALSYTAFLTFLFYPAAPPWLAAQSGYLPGVNRILDQTLSSFPDRLHLPSIYNSFDPNTVAAVPSLHGAYPLLVLLFAVRFFKLKGLLFAPYVLLSWWALIYSGEHYFTDILLGVIYTLVFFYLTLYLPALYRFYKNLNLGRLVFNSSR